MPKVFDIAAFADETRIQVVRRDVDDVIRWRSWLRRATFVDARNAQDAYTHWLGRDRDMKDELKKCLPPWGRAFFYIGVVESEIGVQTETVEATPELLRTAPDPEGKGAAWIVCSRIWTRENIDNSPVLALPEFRMFISHDGALLSAGRTKWAEGLGDISMNVYPLFVSQLLHCRGVAAEPQSPYKPALPRGKRKKAPKITYHKLHIGDPAIQRKDSEPTGNHGVAKHLCRGSFAHYGPDSPLFGKYVGVFWRPAHIKGRAEHGIRGKEYAMVGK